MTLPVRMQYRGFQFVKAHIVRYLTAIFKANSTSPNHPQQLLFTDGVKEIKFSKIPFAIESGGWDPRQIPVVLVAEATGGFTERTFADGVLLDEGGDDAGQFRHFGGDCDINLNLLVRASTKPERDNLADITCIFMTHPAAKEYFGNQDIKLPEPPTVGGESQIEEPAVDYPIYETTIGLKLHTSWSEWEPLEVRLQDIISDIVVELSL